MPVDPFLQPLLEHLPVNTEPTDFAAWRAASNHQGDVLFTTLGEPGPAIRERQAFTVPVDGGTIEVYVYQPLEAGPHPMHLFLHGGGWMLGTIHGQFNDATCRERCAGAQCVVVAVEYRKAPEHKYPTGLNDCHAALLWAVAHAEKLGINPDLITIGGSSAGANLAAALTLKLRDEGGPRVAFQVLEVPALDLTLTTSTHPELDQGYGLTRPEMELCRRAYLEHLDQAGEPYVSPLKAADLSGLPPAHIMISEFDPLRDDGAVYAERLAQAGVPVTLTLGEGHIHGSSAFTQAMASARAWREELIATLRAAHGIPDTAVAATRVTALLQP
ncbi:alpha/beta hydrolase [Deinococcus sp. KSM4-11]|uniref:alpha/beta hydrolase n=1 Tax=Deinococcus sp. KSM4-11 TaxID=2568654 RepID=UPI0010A51E04|nr:alpha/beta hydrolase [Deinococcus sp. KSM4-11]THF85484.1 alpha/beta hydrolase [Deinococcus sp. KSM4-11]